MTRPRPAADIPNAPTPSGRWPAVGLVVVLLLVAAAVVVPKINGWDVYEDGVHPLSARWDPRFGLGTVPAVVVGLAVFVGGPRLTRSLPLRRLLPLAYLTGLFWMIALATVDGAHGLEFALRKPTEYLPTARSVHDVPAMLHQFIDRIPFSAAPRNWPVNIAGHPPGALLFFVGLDRVGLGGDLAAALVVVAIAATAPLAVVVTLRRLGAEAAARTAMPFLVAGPSAIWLAVSADAVFVAVSAWGIALLAVAATTTSRVAVTAFGLAAGIVLGVGILMSYGLVLMAVIALGVLIAARRATSALWAIGGAGIVVVAFALAGFAWWRAYPVLRNRYWDGAAHLRPGAYWTWADLALLAISAGPVLGPALAALAQRVIARSVDPSVRVVCWLVSAAALAVALADASQMSRAEVERIWLPFEPWLLIGTALLSPAWRRWGLAGQLVTALVVQSLLFTRW